MIEIETMQKQKVVVSTTKTGWFITQQHFHETQFDLGIRITACEEPPPVLVTLMVQQLHKLDGIIYSGYFQGIRGISEGCGTVCVVSGYLSEPASVRALGNRKSLIVFSVKSWKSSGHFSIWSKT